MESTKTPPLSVKLFCRLTISKWLCLDVRTVGAEIVARRSRKTVAETSHLSRNSFREIQYSSGFLKTSTLEIRLVTTKKKTNFKLDTNWRRLVTILFRFLMHNALKSSILNARKFSTKIVHEKCARKFDSMYRTLSVGVRWADASNSINLFRMLLSIWTLQYYLLRMTHVI